MAAEAARTMTTAIDTNVVIAVPPCSRDLPENCKNPIVIHPFSHVTSVTYRTAKITESSLSFDQNEGWETFIRVAARLSIMCADGRIDRPGGAPVLGRLGFSCRQ